MTNFILGFIAGGVMAIIATIAAVRQPDIQARLGLFPISTAMMMPAAKLKDDAPKLDLPCRPGVEIGQTDLLFSRRRFWSVAP
ncbi:hypothetical protein G3T14_12535 [Methylobacterium sp. BTF04]|uniref:hypothetical protein n=1 Tax=Methylobacterium sp. BTF04 TaxID=2708300 RepID=UPI0013D11873|nr:hypothetical protein [Methylobacterium sp. BTF04]NEU12960.1 hypothetical protein [Methylobacterium sp. BTF04]